MPYAGEIIRAGDCCAADGTRRHAAAPPPSPTPAAANPPGDAGVGGLTVQGLPIIKPPYGILSAINLDRCEIVWQVPHGDMPDYVRNRPALKGLNIPKTGQPGTSGVGLMVTKTLVVMGDAQITAPPGRPRGAMLRAYDKGPARRSELCGCPRHRAGRP